MCISANCFVHLGELFGGDLLVLELRLAVGDALLKLEHLDLAGLDLHRCRCSDEIMISRVTFI